MALYKNTRMRMLRQAEGLLATEVWKKLGIGKEIYTAVENGRLIPSKRIQKLLAEFYKLPFETLIEEFDKELVVSAITSNTPNINK
ncbi:MAG: helix-turn-helix transcriptional regulator [Ruminiclostridium sp.]|nr:helix-turn-helix transcriptional regulator [Ruminiclostridium sp.]